MKKQKKIKWIAKAILLLLFKSIYSEAVAPEKLVVGEGFTNPLGFHDATPTFSWKLPVGIKKQTAYHIEVRDDKITWNSGWVKSDKSVFVHYAGKPLSSRQRLQWRVQFCDENGKTSDWSNSATFELGLLTAKDWKAQWIHPSPEKASPVSEFKLLKAVYRSKKNHIKNKDVTRLLQKKVQNNKLSVNVNNDEFEGDPAVKELKELIVTYLADGKEETRILNENYSGTFPCSKKANEPVAVLNRKFSLQKKNSTSTIICNRAWIV